MRKQRLSSRAAAALVPLVLTAVALAGEPADPPHYLRKSTWPETLIASREALAAREAEQSQRSREQEASEAIPGVQLGSWYSIGTFRTAKDGFATVHPPEKGVDLEKKYDKLRWRKQPRYADGYPHRLRGSYCTTYLTRTIAADAPKTLTAYLGADDCIAVWLNGKQVYSRARLSGLKPNSDKVKLPLAKGENRLLLKIWNAGGDYGFYFHTSPRVKGDASRDLRKEQRERLWDLVARDFPALTTLEQMSRERADGLWNKDWKPGDLRNLASRYAGAIRTRALADQARAILPAIKAPADLEKVRALYHRSKSIDEATAAARSFDFQAVQLAVRDLTATFPRRYPHGPRYLAELDALQKAIPLLLEAAGKGDEAAIDRLAEAGQKLIALRRKALLANPLLDFGKLLCIKRRFGASARKVISRSLGFASLNSHVHNTIPNPVGGWDDEIAVLSDLPAGGTFTPLFKPEGGRIVCDIDLHFDADRMLLSMCGSHNRFQVFELRADGSGLRQLTPTDLPDIDHFDACYLPDGRIAFCSTAPYQALPCENGSRPVSPLFLMNGDGSGIRQLTFEQDSDFCPVVKNDGKLMYLRWEYSDTPHYFSRILFHCNPDGTEQMELYGSNSYFPNAYMFARPIPGSRAKVVGIVGGHHGISRSGRLVIIDTALSRHEADGVVQEIPGRGKTVEPTIRDRLIDGVWPQFLHPYPLSDKYFLAAMKPNGGALWGIYLVDVFDNLLLLKELEGHALLEPVPFRKTPTPPIIHDKVNLRSKDATVYLMDVYAGRGLAGVPRGTVKKLRLFAYHYCYNRSGGHASVGVESSWDIKRILGTVPVEADGSAAFRIPANTPISVQPLDEQGRALQLMRTWLVGMPGEIVSCVGCHEKQQLAPHNTNLAALLRPPSDIEPWDGPTRPFGFAYEVQPVLDRYCVACHNGKPRPDGKALPNFADKSGMGRFSKSYMALQPYVRRPGPESDIHIFKPMEYHASTSELIQMLEKGHHGVSLDREAWGRLAAWIDLNAPFVGKWSPREWAGFEQRKRRIELAKCYAAIDDDPEAEYDAALAALDKRGPITPITPKPVPKEQIAIPKAPGWPFDAAEAKKRQAAAGKPVTRSIQLAEGLALELALIPAGEFVMGDPAGYPDERPLARVRIPRPFWIARTETTNAQYQAFDRFHDSRFIDQQWKDHTTPGYPANRPSQPAIRISWNQAMGFCRWLSEKTGQEFTLPTEAQWEWACRGGTATPFYYGGLDSDFAKTANLADASVRLLAVRGVNPRPIAKPGPFEDFTPKDARFDDGQKIVTDVAAYQPNPWGLHDMHGNVAEWTRTTYRPYPYRPSDGRDDPATPGRKVARGGSWRDRPKRARSAFRFAFQPYQPVAYVGFRRPSET